MISQDKHAQRTDSKGGFTFANCLHFPETLQAIERMPESTFDEIMDKYIGTIAI